MSPTDTTLFAKANCALPAIDGPMLNRSSLTPIYPASLSDCDIPVVDPQARVNFTPIRRVEDDDFDVLADGASLSAAS